MNFFQQQTVPQVTSEAVKKAMDNKEDCILLDVRTEGEYSRGSLAGSINLPVDRVDCDILKVIPDTSAKIYVYCLSGSRSVHAVDVMVRHGYTNVFDMQKGLLGWRANRFPME